MTKYDPINRKTTINLIRKGTRGVYSESQLIIPALIILSENPSGIRTSELIQKLETMLKPRAHNAEIISGRKDTYFSQKVRNLKSHNTLTSKGLATYKRGLWKITNRGSIILEENEHIYTLLHAQGFKPERIERETDGDYSRIVIEEGLLEFKTSKQRRRSQKLTRATISEFKKTQGNKVFCVVCKFDFSKCYGEYGKDYIEIDHISTTSLIPFNVIYCVSNLN